MQAIEFETTVDHKGNLHLPEKYHDVYGKHVRLMVLLPQSASEKTMDPMKYYSGPRFSDSKLRW